MHLFDSEASEQITGTMLQNPDVNEFDPLQDSVALTVAANNYTQKIQENDFDDIFTQILDSKAAEAVIEGEDKELFANLGLHEEEDKDKSEASFQLDKRSSKRITESSFPISKNSEYKDVMEFTAKTGNSKNE